MENEIKKDLKNLTCVKFQRQLNNEKPVLQINYVSLDGAYNNSQCPRLALGTHLLRNVPYVIQLG
jgi:hypothetical protein